MIDTTPWKGTIPNGRQDGMPIGLFFEECHEEKYLSMDDYVVDYCLVNAKRLQS